MSVFFADIEKIISDKAVTQPMSTVSIPTPFQRGTPDWGSRWANGPHNMSAPYLENFPVPVYQPDPAIVPKGTINVQGTAQLPRECPSTTLLLRNPWETYNTASGKYYGGFDPYSIRNVPSCVERSGNYMNFIDFATNPWARVIDGQTQDAWAISAFDGNWSKPMPRWQEERLRAGESNN